MIRKRGCPGRLGREEGKGCRGEGGEGEGVRVNRWRGLQVEGVGEGERARDMIKDMRS